MRPILILLGFLFFLSSVSFIPLYGTARAAPPVALPLSSMETRQRQGGEGGDCVTGWFVSYAGTAAYTQVFTDTSNLPLESLAFGRAYNDPYAYAAGYLDFNNDYRSDIFNAYFSLDGYWHWRYAPGGNSEWQALGRGTQPIEELRFGEFDGDSYSDVFWVTPRSDGLLQWKYSPRGTGGAVNLAYDGTPLNQLHFGDFDGNNKTDVFITVPDGAGGFNWLISYDSTNTYVQVNNVPIPPYTYQFADVNGDTKTDVIGQSELTNGLYQWGFSAGATEAYQVLVNVNKSLTEVQMADFNADGYSDFFYTEPQEDGTWDWRYVNTRPSPHDEYLNTMPTNPATLRPGDFDGDHKTDIFTLEQQCPMPTETPTPTGTLTVTPTATRTMTPTGTITPLSERLYLPLMQK